MSGVIIPAEIGYMIFEHYRCREREFIYPIRPRNKDIRKTVKIYNITLDQILALRLVCIGLCVDIGFVLEHTPSVFGRSWHTNVMYTNSRLEPQLWYVFPEHQNHPYYRGWRKREVEALADELFRQFLLEDIDARQRTDHALGKDFMNYSLGSKYSRGRNTAENSDDVAVNNITRAIEDETANERAHRMELATRLLAERIAKLRNSERVNNEQYGRLFERNAINMASGAHAIIAPSLPGYNIEDEAFGFVGTAASSYMMPTPIGDRFGPINVHARMREEPLPELSNLSLSHEEIMQKIDHLIMPHYGPISRRTDITPPRSSPRSREQEIRRIDSAFIPYMGFIEPRRNADTGEKVGMMRQILGRAIRLSDHSTLPSVGELEWDRVRRRLMDENIFPLSTNYASEYPANMDPSDYADYIDHATYRRMQMAGPYPNRPTVVNAAVNRHAAARNRVKRTKVQTGRQYAKKHFANGGGGRH